MSTISEQLQEARHQMDHGDPKVAVRILDPLVKRGIADAIYLRSCISLAPEAVEAFHQRRLLMLWQAADLDHPDALYTLSVMYEYGDEVEVDQQRSEQLLQRAALAGHLNARCLIGESLLFGTAGYVQDVAKGKLIIEQAARDKAEGALLTLALLYGEGLFGYPKDQERARLLREQAGSDDAVPI